MKKHIITLNIAADRLRTIEPNTYIGELSENATIQDCLTYHKNLWELMVKHIDICTTLKDGNGITIADYINQAIEQIQKYLFPKPLTIFDISENRLKSLVRIYDSSTYYVGVNEAQNVLFNEDGSLRIKWEDGEWVDVHNGNIYEILNSRFNSQLKHNWKRCHA